jgi:hypothetical protein
MKTTRKTERLHVRFDGDVMTWLRRAAQNKRTTVSEVARQIVHAAFDQRRKA